MKTTRHRIFPFEACSVLLFSALLIGTATASHAQLAQGTAAQPSFGPATTAPATPSKFTIGPAAPTAATPQAAFDKADTNHDGKLSPQEAATHMPKGQGFQQMDSNHDGFLSREEFDQGGVH